MLTIQRNEISDAILCLSLEGKILSDTDNELLLATVAEKLAEVKGKLFIDLEALSHINSSGLNALIKLMTKARIQGGDLVLCGLQGTTKKLFEIAKMDEVFRIVEDFDQAKNIFNQQK